MCWSDGYNYLAGSSDLSEVFHCIVLISDGNGRARIGKTEFALEPSSKSILNSGLAS